MPSSIDRHAHSYELAAEAYESGRPEYPAEAVAHLVRVLRITSASTVLDVGAGTGKFTRLLVPTGARLLAVEPVAGMRAKLASRLPGIEVLEAAAESIPLPAASVDAVTVAQAFHWFRGQEALAEFRRVLRPGGGLALTWNVRQESVDWVRKLSELMDPHGGGAPRYHTGLWREAFAVPNEFTPLQVACFPFSHAGTPEQIVNRAASTSFVAGLAEAERVRLLDAVRQMLADHPQTRGRARVDFHYETEVYWCRAA